ncbi:CoA transferase [uncultured Jatrophihabitans sp.]|uniref:CoA transferase n=1 Tax=uncultured Jatrophihabitans sp. TaxID=1610747 RepID=UPI0035CA5FAE
MTTGSDAAAEDRLVDEAWRAVAGDEGVAAGGPVAPELTRTGSPSALPGVVGAVATASVAAALQAAATLAARRNGRVPTVAVDRVHVADAVRSERLFRVEGRPAGAGFAPLSRFWPTADGHVRTHANYPWHRAALLRALDLPDEAGADEVAGALGRRTGEDVEERVFAEGGVAARVRTAAEWDAHLQGAAVRGEPLVGHEFLGAAPPRSRSPADLPAEGVRVLDLTRVIAGPVCTRLLGALGADVLRLDPPDRPDTPPGSPADTLLGKRSAALDLAAGPGPLLALLDEADVLVCGYRPGALDRLGLADDDLARRHPGLVVVRLSAWGHTGPWRERRGFDSVVQAGVGIADAESAQDGVTGDEPGALPCQLLDHATGYLAAAAVLDGLRRQAEHGGTVLRRLSLARTAQWLLDQARPSEAPATPWPPSREWTTRVGPVEAVAPPGRIDDRALRWPEPPNRYLAEPPAWAGRP